MLTVPLQRESPYAQKSSNMWSAGIPRHFPKNLPHTPEGRSDCSDTVAGLGADVWRWSALGKVAKRLWDAMEGQTTRELTRAFGSSLRTVQRHLRKLKDERLSEQSKDGRGTGLSGISLNSPKNLALLETVRANANATYSSAFFTSVIVSDQAARSSSSLKHLLRRPRSILVRGCSRLG